MNLPLFHPSDPIASCLVGSGPGGLGSGSVAAARAAADPVTLHPGLWRAHQLGGGRQGCTASGHAVLDAELPGGGWPHGTLTELLLPHPGVGELRLLAPALAALQAPGAAQAPGHCVMLFAPPARPCSQALAQLGLDTRGWLVVQPRAPRGRAPAARHLLPDADVLWALEQSLRSGQSGAVLAWLPGPLKTDTLRRLQLAAQGYDGPVFIFRETQARLRPSPAPLRLGLQAAAFDGLVLQVLKRRGPPPPAPLRLSLAPVLLPSQQRQALVRRQAGTVAPGMALA